MILSFCVFPLLIIALNNSMCHVRVSFYYCHFIYRNSRHSDQITNMTPYSKYVVQLWFMPRQNNCPYDFYKNIIQVK